MPNVLIARLADYILCQEGNGLAQAVARAGDEQETAPHAAEAFAKANQTAICGAKRR